MSRIIFVALLVLASSASAFWGQKNHCKFDAVFDSCPRDVTHVPEEMRNIEALDASFTCHGWTGKPFKLYAVRKIKNRLDQKMLIKQFPGCDSSSCTFAGPWHIPLELRVCSTDARFYLQVEVENGGFFRKTKFDSCTFRPSDYLRGLENCEAHQAQPNLALQPGTCKCVDKICYPNGTETSFPGDGSLVENGHPWCFVEDSCGTKTKGSSNNCEGVKRAYMDGDESWGKFTGAPSLCHPKVEVDENNPDNGHEDAYSGWYDIQKCGSCFDYCRWVEGEASGGDPKLKRVNGSSYWSCRLAKTHEQRTPPGHFEKWDYRRCDGMGMRNPDWDTCVLTSVHILSEPHAESKGTKILAGSTGTACGTGGAKVKFDQSQDRTITNSATLGIASSTHWEIKSSVATFGGGWASAGLWGTGAGLFAGGALTLTAGKGGQYETTQEDTTTISESASSTFGLEQELMPNSGAIFMLTAEEFEYPSLSLDAEYTTMCGKVERKHTSTVVLNANGYSSFKPFFLQQDFDTTEQCFKQQFCINTVSPAFGVDAITEQRKFISCFPELAGTLLSPAAPVAYAGGFWALLCGLALQLLIAVLVV